MGLRLEFSEDTSSIARLTKIDVEYAWPDIGAIEQLGALIPNLSNGLTFRSRFVLTHQQRKYLSSEYEPRSIIEAEVVRSQIARAMPTQFGEERLEFIHDGKIMIGDLVMAAVEATDEGETKGGIKSGEGEGEGENMNMDEGDDINMDDAKSSG